MILDITQLKERRERIQAEITTIQSSSLTDESFRRLQELIDQLAAIDIELEAEERRAERMLTECDLGRRFADRTFRNFDGNAFNAAYQTALEYAKGFPSNPGEGLIFTGNPGTGKTHLAAAITNHIIGVHKVPVKFVSYVDFLESLKAGFSGKEKEDEVKRLNEIPLLVIDDLGKERTSEWSNAVLYRIVNMRYEHCLPVIITTNETISDLEKAVGEATVSRLMEMCKGVRMVGADHRKESLRRK